MKRANRLRRPEQFQRVRREGQRWEGGILALQAAPTRRQRTRCGFVVGKRIGNAVMRNRCRRRVREAVRLIYDQIAPGWDLVFIIRSPAAATVAFEQVRANVEQVLRAAGALREPPPRETG